MIDATVQPWEWNPQLLREVKKIRPVSLIGSVLVALLVQGLIIYFFCQRLPQSTTKYNYYCTGQPSHFDLYQCLISSSNNISVDWNLWWLNIFVFHSSLTLFTLLIVGSFLLAADIYREKSSGSLAAIKLSPQTAYSFYLSKLIGVPILIYCGTLLSLPLNFYAAQSAGIPLQLWLSFCLTVLIGCIFFYLLSIWLGLILNSSWLWIIGISLTVGLALVHSWVWWGNRSGNYTLNCVLDWLKLFYPGAALVYLVHHSSVLNYKITYLSQANWSNLYWYELPLWRDCSLGMGWIVLNYLWWIYWLAKAIKLHYNRLNWHWWQGCIVINSFAAIALGFSLHSYYYNALWNNLIYLLIFDFLLYILIALYGFLTHQISLSKNYIKFLWLNLSLTNLITISGFYFYFTQTIDRVVFGLIAWTIGVILSNHFLNKYIVH